MTPVVAFGGVGDNNGRRPRRRRRRRVVCKQILIAGVVVLLFLLRLGNSFADPAHTSRALLAGFFSVLRTHVMLLLYAAVVAHDASQGSIPESLNLSNIFILFHLRDFHLLLSLFFRLRY